MQNSGLRRLEFMLENLNQKCFKTSIIIALYNLLFSLSTNCKPVTNPERYVMFCT
jgi:hypothetical protein